MKRACMRRPWTFIRIREYLSCLSIASVNGKQYLISIVRKMMGFGSYPYTQDSSPVIMVFMKSGWLWSPTCPVSPGCMGTTRNPSFYLQWKSDESTKHYLTQMLLAINWHYWQAGKKFAHAYGGSRSPLANAFY